MQNRTENRNERNERNEFVAFSTSLVERLLENRSERDRFAKAIVEITEKAFNEGRPQSMPIRVANRVEKDYLLSESDTGGPFQEISYWDEVIPLLRNASIVRANTSKVLPIPTGKLQLRRQTESSIAYWVAEAANIPKSTGKYEAVLLVPKKLAGIAVFSNDVLRYTGSLIVQTVQNDLIQAVAEKEDETFILSTGTANTPKGLYGYAPSSNKIDITGMDEVEAVKSAIAKLASGKAYKKPIWIMPPQAFVHLQFIQNTQGAFVFPETQQNILRGFPVFTTTLIPYTTGKTKVFLVDASEMVIGQGVTLTLEFFPNGAYYDGTGVVSGISADESVYRIIEEVDFFLQHNTSVVVLENVTWGA